MRVRQVVQIHTEVFYCYALRIFEVSAWPNCDINQYYSVPIGRLGDWATVRSFGLIYSYVGGCVFMRLPAFIRNTSFLQNG